MNNPLVSVVISNYNYARFLPTCIDSVRNQTYRPVEIIVVDDGSTDDSREVLERYPDVTSIFKQNGGQASAINAGVAASNGEVICFLDCDDGWHPMKVERVVASFRSDVGWVRHKAQMVDEQLQPMPAFTPNFSGSGRIPTDPALFIERTINVQPSCLAITREVADQVFPLVIPDSLQFDADDAVMLARIFATGRHGYSIDEVLGWYRRHPGERFGAHDIPKLLRREADVTEALPQVFNRTTIPSAAYKLRVVLASLEGRDRFRPFIRGLGAAARLYHRPTLMMRQAAAITLAFVAPGVWLRKLARASAWPPVE